MRTTYRDGVQGLPPQSERLWSSCIKQMSMGVAGASDNLNLNARWREKTLANPKAAFSHHQEAVKNQVVYQLKGAGHAGSHLPASSACHDAGRGFTAVL